MFNCKNSYEISVKYYETFSGYNHPLSLICEIGKLINSNDVNEIVEGYFIVGEQKQTHFISGIFNNANDGRISHHYKFKGISVYQSKMIAMKKISGISPPIKINYKPDSLVIDFYYSWALKNNYIKKRKK